MVILASDQKELGVIKDVNLTIDTNGERVFSLEIARNRWHKDLSYSNYIYVPDTEFGGRIGAIMTTTTLDYVELKGMTWRGMLAHKVIEPPAGSDYKTVSGELHSVLQELIEPEFDGLFIVSGADTGIKVSGFKFDRYCTLLSGIENLLKSVGYRLNMTHKRSSDKLRYVFIEAVPVVDHSDKIELSRDCRMNYEMEDTRNGVNHLIVTGKGELQERNVFHLYMWPDGSIKSEPYYTGRDEIAMVYENTSTETAELQSQSEEFFRSVANKKIFKMDIQKLGINVGIGDIVGGRDYLTGLYATKPIENIIYSIFENEISIDYILEGDDET